MDIALNLLEFGNRKKCAIVSAIDTLFLNLTQWILLLTKSVTDIPFWIWCAFFVHVYVSIPLGNMSVQRFSRAGPWRRGREWATLGVHPLSWLLSNNRLEKVCGTLTKGTFSSRLLLSNQDKGCTPSVAHSLPLPLPPGVCSTCQLTIKRRCMRKYRMRSGTGIAPVDFKGNLSICDQLQQKLPQVGSYFWLIYS